MAEITSTLFFKNNRVYGVGALTFNLIISESHSFTGQATSYNIEDGSIISDHIQNNKKTGSLTGLITNFSLNDTVLTGNKAQNAFDILEQIYEKKELVDVVTVLKVYSNVYINSITVNRDKDTGEAIFADISFEEMKIVKLKTIQIIAAVNIKDTATDINRQSSPISDKGKQSKVERLFAEEEIRLAGL